MVRHFGSRLLYGVVFVCLCLLFTCFYCRGGSGNDRTDTKTEPSKLEEDFIGKPLNVDVFVGRDERILNLTENEHVNRDDTKRQTDFSTTTRKEIVAKPLRSVKMWKSPNIPFSTSLPSSVKGLIEELTTIAHSNEIKWHSNGGKDVSSVENQAFQQNDFKGKAKRNSFDSFTTQHRRNRRDVDALSKTKTNSTECANFTSTIKYEDRYSVWNNFSMKYRERVYHYKEYRITGDGLQVCGSSDSDTQRRWINLVVWEKEMMASKHCNVSVDGFYPENYTVYKNLTVFFKPNQQYFTRKDYGVIFGYFLICSTKLSLSCHDYLVKVRYGEQYNVFNNFSLIYDKKMYNYREYRLTYESLELCASSDARVQAVWETRNSWEKFVRQISCNYVILLYYTVNKQFIVYWAANGQYFTRNDYFVNNSTLIICKEKLRPEISEYTKSGQLMCNDSIINIKYSDDYKVRDDFSMLYKNKVYHYTEYRVLNDSIKICNSTDNFVRTKWELRNCWVKGTMHYRSCNQPLLLVEVYHGRYTVLKDFKVHLYGPYTIITKYDYGVLEGKLIICVEKLPNILGSCKTLLMVAIIFCPLAASIISLLLLLIVYCMLPELRTLPGLNLMSLSLAFLLFSTFLVVFFSLLCAGEVSKLSFTELYVASLFATYNILINAAVNVYHLRKTFCGNTLVKSDENKWKSFLEYCFFSWGVPIIITIVYTVLVLTDVLRFHSDVFRTCIHNGPCWLAVTVVYGLPGCLLLSIIVAFIFTAYRINQKLKASSSIAEKSHIVRTRKNFVLLLKLSTILVTTTLFSLPNMFEIFLPRLNVHLGLTLITLTLLSGVFLGIAFVFTGKNYRLLKKKYFPIKNKQHNNLTRNKANK